jgi:DNA-binding XRE family transcriptional regulator
MTEAERKRSRAAIRAMSIEQAEEGVVTLNQRLIEVEAAIAANTQALAAVAAMGPRFSFKGTHILRELRSLSGRKADMEWRRDEYTQRVSGQEHKAAKQSLKKLRTDAGLTQAGLASIVGIDAGTLGRIERGSQKPFPGNAGAIADALSKQLNRLVHPDDLLLE